MRVTLLVLIAIAIAAPAAAQRAPRPVRADFERAVLDRAATTVPAEECEGADREPRPPRTLTRAERAGMLGRVIALPDGRSAAIVRRATGEADANGALAYALSLVVLERSSDAWAASVTELETPRAPYHYGERVVLVARLEDLDDDPERELLVVLETDTEVVCGPGSCTERRTMVLDPNERAVPVIASVPTRSTCESTQFGSEIGTVLFRDVDGDGHRDLVRRTRACAHEEDEDGVPAEEETCQPAREIVQLWLPATDRYAPPPS